MRHNEAGDSASGLEHSPLVLRHTRAKESCLSDEEGHRLAFQWTLWRA